MERDAARMCALLVSLPAVDVIGVELNVPIRVHVETASDRPNCDGCGVVGKAVPTNAREVL